MSVPSAQGTRLLRTEYYAPVHRVFVSLAHGAFPLCTGCIYSLHTVHVPTVQGLCPICTGCLSCVQGARPLCTQLSCTQCTGYTSRPHMVPVPSPQDTCRAVETDQLHGAHAEPELVLSTAPRGAAPHCRAAWLAMRPGHLCPGSPGRHTITSNHLCKLSSAFLQGAGQSTPVSS